MKIKDQNMEALKKEIDEKEERVQFLMSTLPGDEREMKTKLLNQQKNMEQLTLMYHSLGSQKNLLSKENRIYEKKLLRITEQRKELEK